LEIEPNNLIGMPALNCIVPQLDQCCCCLFAQWYYEEDKEEEEGFEDDDAVAG